MGLWTPAPLLPTPLLVTTGSRLTAGLALRAFAAAAPASTVIGASATIVFPIVLEEPARFVKAFVMNGATINGNFDIGIYDAGLKLITSTGSTAQSGANALQEVDIADFTLDAGAYHLAFGLSSATAAYFAWNSGLSRTGGANFQTSSAFPIPATFVSAGTTTGTMMFGFSQRVLVA